MPQYLHKAIRNRAISIITLILQRKWVRIGRQNVLNLYTKKHTTLRYFLNIIAFLCGFHIPHWFGWKISCLDKAPKDPRKPHINV